MRAIRPGAAAAIALGFIGGYADATGYVRWHTFGANMTGNTVLLVIKLVEHSTDVTRPVIPIVGFVMGALLAGMLRTRFNLRLLMALEAAALCAAGLLHGAVFELGFLAMAMGLQSGSLPELEGVRAGTTFITGDYTNFAAALGAIGVGSRAAQHRSTLEIVGPLILSYAAGALAGAVCAHTNALSLLFIVPLVLTLGFSMRRRAA